MSTSLAGAILLKRTLDFTMTYSARARKVRKILRSHDWGGRRPFNCGREPTPSARCLFLSRFRCYRAGSERAHGALPKRCRAAMRRG